MTEKLHIAMDELTLGELHKVRKLAGAPLEEIMQGEDQALGLAALVTVFKQRDDPTFTIEDALQLPLKDLQMGEPDPEVPSGGNGVTPLSSPAPGPSTLQTS